MRCDDTDCGDNGMPWAISKLSCDATRSDEMRQDPNLKRDGTGMKSQEIVSAKHRSLPEPYSGTFFVSFYSIIGYKCFNSLPPACPGTTWSWALFTFRYQISYSSATADCSIFFHPTWAFRGWFEDVHLLSHFSCSKTSWSAWSTKNAGSGPKNGALAGGIAKKHQRGAACGLCRATFPAWLNSYRSLLHGLSATNQAALLRQTLLDNPPALPACFVDVLVIHLVIALASPIISPSTDNFFLLPSPPQNHCSSLV